MVNKFEIKGVLIALAALAIASCSPAADGPAKVADAGKPTASAAAAGGPVAMRRLTQAQYRQSVEDIFSSAIKLGGRFEPDIRQAGLMAVGASEVSVTASGLEQYDKMARSIALQVVDKANRDALIPCKPASETAPDDACAKMFLSSAGRYIYRRPLTDREVASLVDGTHKVTAKLGDFYTGLSLGLASLLSSPNFLFVQEISEPDPKNSGKLRLNAYSKASRLSFLIWNSTPDDALLQAAEKGELHTAKGVAKQVDRLLASPRVEAGTRAFFSDMLGFDTFDTLAKDTTLYPKFTAKVAVDAQEQTLKTIVDHLVTRNADYRDLYTTGHTFLTPLLGAVYRLPVHTDDALLGSWAPYEYPAGAQQAGILTHASFVALRSPPGRSSPTIRGKALREMIMCQKVPDPPGNVNFDLFNETDGSKFKTVRAKLAAHSREAMCAGCHKIMDPSGLALENFDTIGGFRTKENGENIDVSGELDGVKWTDVVGLGKAVHDSKAVPSCLVNRVFSYGVGHKITPSEKTFISETLLKQFEADGYRLPALLRRIATSEAFFGVAAVEPETKKAALESTIQTANIQMENGK
jgi:hypothetical protein